MTGRHAGQLTPTDTWLTDQLAGWIAEVEQFFTDCDQAISRSGSESTEAMHIRHSQESLRKTVLLCTARQLVTEVLTRG